MRKIYAMAGTCAALLSLRDSQELQSFVIRNVRPVGKQLGRGSYGSVEELEIDGVVCAGKTIYDELVDPGNQGAQRIVDMFLRECNVLSRLRHPHIVQFLGVCFLPSSQLPVLVMEWLHTSLDHILETRPDIPLHTKLCILHDVSKGLVYLHSHDPIIIHRDLTARNVLLNTAMTAKIADMGNSRIVDIPPDQLALTMTPGIPGTMVYMPPEALGTQPHYGPSLDMFSFGQLVLFTAIQVFPQNLQAPSYFDPATNEVKGRTELERRAQYIDILHRMFDSGHSLVVLMKQCLEYEAVRRPTAAQAMERLGEMRASAATDLYADMSRLELEDCLREKEGEILQLQWECQQQKVGQVQLIEACRTKDAEIAAVHRELQDLLLLRAELQRVKDEKTSCDAVIAAKELEITEKDGRICCLQQTCAVLQMQLRTLETTLQSLQHEQKTTLQAKPIEKVKQLQNTQKLSNTLDILTLNLSLEWQETIELRSGVSRPQAVRSNGLLYVAGIESEGGVYKITEYSINDGQSQEIEMPVCWFGMAAVNEQLIIAGGQSHEGESDRVLVMDTHTRSWVEPFPPMPTARESPSAVGYDRWLFVVGGWESRCVEVLDTVSRQWSRGISLPSEATRPSVTCVEDNLYVAWDDTVVSASIPAVVSHAFSSSSNEHAPCPKWQQLPKTLTSNPAITSFNGALLAIGGEPLSSSVSIYLDLPMTERWVAVSKLPTRREQCSCVFIPESGKLLVIGGKGEKASFLKSVEVCTLV